MRTETIQDLTTTRDRLRRKLEAIELLLSEADDDDAGVRQGAQSQPPPSRGGEGGESRPFEGGNSAPDRGAPGGGDSKPSLGADAPNWEKIRSVMEPKRGYSPKELGERLQQAGFEVSQAAIYTTLKRKADEVFWKRNDRWYVR